MLRDIITSILVSLSGQMYVETDIVTCFLILVIMSVSTYICPDRLTRILVTMSVSTYICSDSLTRILVIMSVSTYSCPDRLTRILVIMSHNIHLLS
jgi:hypothetical protein